MRSSQVEIEEGFDGEFGKIRVFKESEIKDFSSKLGLSGKSNEVIETQNKYSIRFDIESFKKKQKQISSPNPCKSAARVCL